MKYLNCFSEKGISIDDIPLPETSSDEVLVRTLFCGLCFTDILLLNDPEKKCAKLGHEVVGIIEKSGEKVKKIKKGDLVAVYHRIPCLKCTHCLHGKYSMCRHARETNLDPQGFSEFIRLTSEHVKYNTFIIEDKKLIKNAVFTEPVATVIRAIDGMPVRKGDNIAVIGCGTMGSIFVRLLDFYGLNVLGLDIDDNKLNQAKIFGAKETLNSKIENICKKINKFAPEGLDAAIVTVANAETVNLAMSILREGGFILLFAGPPGKNKIEIDFALLFKREISILSSYSSFPAINRKSFDLLMNVDKNSLDFTPLISHILPIERFEEGMNLALCQKYFKILFYFNEELVKDYL